MTLVDVIKTINYQFTKDFDESSLSDAQRAEYARGILNAQLQGSVTDAEMPTSMLGATLDWTVGTADDAIVNVSFGSASIDQDLTLPNVEISTALPVPTNLTVSTTETTHIAIEWDHITGAVGYRLVRDPGTEDETIVHDTVEDIGASLSDVSSDNRVKYEDFGAQSDITYEYSVMALASDPANNSEYSAIESGYLAPSKSR